MLKIVKLQLNMMYKAHPAQECFKYRLTEVFSLTRDTVTNSAKIFKKQSTGKTKKLHRFQKNSI